MVATMYNISFNHPHTNFTAHLFLSLYTKNTLPQPHNGRLQSNFSRSHLLFPFKKTFAARCESFPLYTARALTRSSLARNFAAAALISRPPLLYAALIIAASLTLEEKRCVAREFLERAGDSLSFLFSSSGRVVANVHSRYNA